MLRFSPRLLLLVLAATLMLTNVVQAQSGAKKKAAPPAPAKQADEEPTDKAAVEEEDEAPAADPFQLPEESDVESVQKYLEQIVRVRPPEQTPAAIRTHLRKMDGAVVQLFARELDVQTMMMCVNFRMQVLSALGRFGDEQAQPDSEALIKSLADDKRPELQEMAKIYGLVNRLGTVDALPADGRRKLVEDVLAFSSEGPLSGEKVELPRQLCMMLEQIGDLALATEANTQFAKAFEARNDENLAGLIEEMRATGRRLDLPGKTMEVKGQLVGGGDFDLASLKGKVVLVDFWATWCGPCREELPNVKEMYERYHDKGFEVVGISLDENLEDLQAFVDEEKLTWPQIVDAKEENRGWANPIARHYGISGIPAAILIDQEGKVVSLEARGRELVVQLERLLGADENEGAGEEDAAQ